MSRFIVKIRDRYLEWSTVVDAPVTAGMSLDDFQRYYVAEYGPDSESYFGDFIKLANETGASDDYDWRNSNRAGPKETALTEDELYRVYCLGLELDEEVVKHKLLGLEQETSQTPTVAPPLPENPTTKNIQSACDALENGMTISDVEAILGRGETTKRKRRPMIVVRWAFAENVVTCHFDKADGRLNGVMIAPNYRAGTE